ncbi:MAG TPA: hypothetical protein DEF45_13600 [Rhodopirellula sp.]|nr:hypothetical protein [Rhodopirellula sp.]
MLSTKRKHLQNTGTIANTVAPLFALTFFSFNAIFSDGLRAQEQLPQPPTDGFTFNFSAAPWSDVLERFAEETNYSLQLTTVPKGTFHFKSNEQYTATEALDIMNGQLIDAGYILLRRDNFLLVHDLEKDIPPSLVRAISVDELKDALGNEIATLNIPVENGDASLLADEIELLVSEFGAVDVLTESNSIVITDVVRNLRKLDALLMFSEMNVSARPVAVIKLNHAPADIIAEAINQFFGETSASPTATRTTATPRRNTSSSASLAGVKALIVPEMNTNSLLISAQPRYIDLVRQLVRDLDAPPSQVVIKAIMVEVDLDQTDEFGIELGVQDSVLFDRSIISEILTLTETVTNGEIQTTNQSIISQQGQPGFSFNNQPLGNNTAINPSRVGGQGLSNFSVGRINGDAGFGGLVLSGGSDSVNFLLRALASKRNVSILSRPQIRTVHNKLAKIQIGQEVPVVDGVTITAVGNANPVIRQSDAGIILEVTPRISPDGTVVVDVNAEKSAYRSGPGSGVPIFTDATSGSVIEAPIKDLTKADGTVSVQDGQTIVLGGMIGNQTLISEAKVPWLGDIPYVGKLFRHDLETTVRKELLIFLTPTVLRTAEDSRMHDQIEKGFMQVPCKLDAQIDRFTAPQTFQMIDADAVYLEQSSN